MKKLLLFFTLLIATGLNAQTADTTGKFVEKAAVYHGPVAGYNFYHSAYIGYYTNWHLSNRLYLFTRHAIGAVSFDGKPSSWAYMAYSTVSFAIRLNGEHTKWQYFPYLGMGLSWVKYYATPRQHFAAIDEASLNAGFEALCRIDNKHHIGFGVELNNFQGVSCFIKYGWNRPYKHT